MSKRDDTVANKLFVAGVIVGIMHGLAIRFWSKLFPQCHALAVMTIGFMLFVPVAMGFISVYVVERKDAIMRDTQESILGVIKNRCESEATAKN
jgi:hypothetical protein